MNASDRSPFVGRARELEVLDALLDSGAIWVWGPPGVGKSRLVQQWRGPAESDALVVDLATTTSEPEMVRVLSEALGGVTGSTDRQSLADAISQPSRPLVLDNVDAVYGAVESLLVERSPGIVVTCRSAPPGEHFVSLRVEPLSDSEARELFEAVAMESNAGTTAGWDEDVLQELLSRLDGLPLAIEFAARRTRLLSLDAQLARLRQRAPTGSSLDAIVAWMWQQLPPARRAVLVQCSTCGGPFEARFIEATASPAPDADVLEELDELLAASWLQRVPDHGAGMRFRLLHALRDFTINAVPGEELAGARARALAHWAAAAPGLRSAAEGRDGHDALRRLEVERDNLLGAVEFGFDVGDHRALVVLDSLRWNALLVGPTELYTDLVERGRAMARTADDAVAANFLEVAARFAHANGYVRQAVEDSRQAVERARGEGGDSRLLLEAEVTAAIVADDPRITDVLDLALRAGENGLFVTRARALSAVAERHLEAHEVDSADACFREAIDAYRASAHEDLAWNCRAGRARALSAGGRARDAAIHLQRLLEEAAQGGLKMCVPRAHYHLAVALHSSGELDNAVAHLERAVGLWTSLGARGNLLGAYLAAARLWFDLGEPMRAKEAALSAQRLAPAVGDGRRKALADGLTTMLAWVAGRTAMEEDLLLELPVLQARDPIAAVAHLAAFVGMRADRGSAAQREVARAERLIGAHEGAADRVAESLRQLCCIARAFAHLCDAGQAGPAGAASPASLAETELEGVDPQDGPPAARFYKRLLAEEVRRRLDRVTQAGVALPAEYRFDVEFHANCHWIRIDGGDPIDLTSRRQLRVIVKALARQYFMDRTVLLPVEDLLDIGWPGETMTPSSGRSRLYTAIRDLRKMGLEELIVTDEGGYRLAHDVRYRVAAPTGILAPD